MIVTFAGTELIHEPETIEVIVVIFQASFGLDLAWREVRGNEKRKV